MKTKLILTLICATASIAWGQQTITNVTVNTTIPDNDPDGLVSSVALSGLIGSISNVTVSLDITGGYNGDLYAYLVGPNGGFAVLLNRVGVTNGNSYGYSDAGFNNITLDDSAANNNIHYYQNVAGTGAPTGTWASDGENVDPLGSLVGSSPSTATLTSLDGTNPNGNWILFIADLSGGGQATLANWTLNITTVPEPQTWTMLGAGLVAALWFRRFTRR
jgi:subtilisin-like proprotein convertase family protein